jgi:hypothetical protein
MVSQNHRYRAQQLELKTDKRRNRLNSIQGQCMEGKLPDNDSGHILELKLNPMIVKV